MPRYKKGAKEFLVTVRSDAKGQSQTTVPKALMQALAEDGTTEIVGRFVLRENELVLSEEYRVITVDHLLSKWWDTHIPLSQQDEEDLRQLDWDDLLNAIGIHVQDYGEKKPIVGDYDRKDTYGTGTVWVAFVEE